MSKQWRFYGEEINSTTLLTTLAGISFPDRAFFIIFSNTNFKHRNRDNILSSTLHRYSRLCNILLKQGRVSSDLRAKTIDLLGSDDDKEEFFKEFDMFDQLQSFYKSRGRYRELYDLSIDTGDLTTALEVAISHNMRFTVDGKSVEFVFNYVQAETILSRRGSNGAKMQQVNNLAETYESTCLAESALQWQAAMQLLHSIEDEEKRIEISGLKDGIVKDFFCLYVRRLIDPCSVHELTCIIRLSRLSRELSPGQRFQICPLIFSSALEGFCIVLRPVIRSHTEIASFSFLVYLTCPATLNGQLRFPGLHSMKGASQAMTTCPKRTHSRMLGAGSSICFQRLWLHLTRQRRGSGGKNRSRDAPSFSFEVSKSNMRPHAEDTYSFN